LRVARDGGIITAYTYPGLDSVLWRSVTRAPALADVIGFGADDGYLAATDRRQSPVRIDLRLGAVSRARDSLLPAMASVDGAAIYALTPQGTLTRFTPSGGDWQLEPTLPVSALLPQGDGSLIVAGASGKEAIVWRVRPPGADVVDTLRFSVGGDAAANQVMISATAGSVGDRVFFGANESVIAVRTRDMQPALELDLGDPVHALAATPSGDRLFAALVDERSLRVIDRFEEKVSGRIKLPAVPRALRMDPLGRVLLARGAGDSVFVISVATDDVLGMVRTEWRADLPAVMADGHIALVRGDDVVLAAPGTLADGRTVAGGARDVWYQLRWNGFRPRAAGLDQPVEFRRSAPRDSGLPPAPTMPADSAAGEQSTASETEGRDPDAKAPEVYTLSFAAVNSERAARELASQIRIGGQSPRITSAERGGATLYRVVMGPFSSRAEADRVGKASGQSYWIFEGVP